MGDNVLTVTTADLDGAVRFLEPTTGRQLFRTSVLPIDTIAVLTNGLTFGQTVVTNNSVVFSFDFTPEFSLMGGVAVFDATTGARRWAHRLIRTAGGGSDHPRYLAVANGVVVVATRSNVVFAYDEFTGNLLWTANTLPLTIPFSQGYTGILAVVGNYVTVVNQLSRVNAFDRQTGEPVQGLNGPLDLVQDIQWLRGNQAFIQSGLRMAIVDLATNINHWETISSRASYRREFVVLAGDTLVDANSAYGLRSFKLPP